MFKICSLDLIITHIKKKRNIFNYNRFIFTFTGPSRYEPTGFGGYDQDGRVLWSRPSQDPGPSNSPNSNQGSGGQDLELSKFY